MENKALWHSFYERQGHLLPLSICSSIISAKIEGLVYVIKLAYNGPFHVI